MNHISLHTQEKTEYCSHWQDNATTFAAQGCYEWMAKQLLPHKPKRVLDIGCGTGEGILALLSIGVDTIVSLEENFDCIKATEKKLIAQGFHVSVISRIGYEDDINGRHDLIVDQKSPIVEVSPITIVHADVLFYLNDNPLLFYLKNSTKFDAVTAWLMGVTNVRNSCKSLDCFNFKHPRDYRLKVQNIAYDIADIVLKTSGVFQAVDRGIVPDTDELKALAFKGHEEQASVTSLKVSDFAYRLYNEPTKRGVSMTGPLANDSRISDDGRRAMHSMISFKK